MYEKIKCILTSILIMFNIFVIIFIISNLHFLKQFFDETQKSKGHSFHLTREEIQQLCLRIPPSEEVSISFHIKQLCESSKNINKD